MGVNSSLLEVAFGGVQQQTRTNSAHKQARPATSLCRQKGLLLFGITCSRSGAGETPPCRHTDGVWLKQKETSGKCGAGEPATALHRLPGTCPPAGARQQGLTSQVWLAKEQPSLGPSIREENSAQGEETGFLCNVVS